MPTYNYRCEHCDREMEIFQPITANPKKTCPHCGKRTLRRLLGTGAGVIFKGSGFYETDYRSENYKKAAEKEKPAEGTKTDKKESKTESKTDSKPKTESAVRTKTE